MRYIVDYSRIDEVFCTVHEQECKSLASARRLAKKLSMDPNIFIAYVVNEERTGCIAYANGSFSGRDGVFIS